MRILQLAKNMLKYLPVFMVLAATVVGLLIGNNLYPGLLESQSETLTQSPSGTNELYLLTKAEDTCAFPLVYTSLPPKCKTSEGKYIPLPGTSYIFVIPERK